MRSEKFDVNQNASLDYRHHRLRYHQLQQQNIDGAVTVGSELEQQPIFDEQLLQQRQQPVLMADCSSDCGEPGNLQRIPAVAIVKPWCTTPSTTVFTNATEAPTRREVKVIDDARRVDSLPRSSSSSLTRTGLQDGSKTSNRNAGFSISDRGSIRPQKVGAATVITAGTVQSQTGPSRHSSVVESPAPVSADVIPSKIAADDNDIPDGYVRVTQAFMPTSVQDEQRLMINCRHLNLCTFYTGPMTSHMAKERLRHASVGSFVVRDSAHPRFLYTLSIKTRRGVTSIRLAYSSTGFSLDSDPDQASTMRSFETVVDLVVHYTAEGRRMATNGTKSSCVFLEKSGRRDLPVFLRFPYLGGNGGSTTAQISSLKHLSRLAVNSALASRDPERLLIKPTLKTFLMDYPYSI